MLHTQPPGSALWIGSVAGCVANPRPRHAAGRQHATISTHAAPAPVHKASTVNFGYNSTMAELGCLHVPGGAGNAWTSSSTTKRAAEAKLVPRGCATDSRPSTGLTLRGGMCSIVGGGSHRERDVVASALLQSFKEASQPIIDSGILDSRIFAACVWPPSTPFEPLLSRRGAWDTFRLLALALTYLRAPPSVSERFDFLDLFSLEALNVRLPFLVAEQARECVERLRPHSSEKAAVNEAVFTYVEPWRRSCRMALTSVLSMVHVLRREWSSSDLDAMPTPPGACVSRRPLLGV